MVEVFSSILNTNAKDQGWVKVKSQVKKTSGMWARFGLSEFGGS